MVIRKIISVCLYLLLQLYVIQGYSAESIYGKWVATESSMGGLRGALTIMEEGALISTTIVMLDSTYSVTDDKITFYLDDDKVEYFIDRKIDVMEWTINGQANKLLLRRTYKDSGVNNDSLLGHWTFTHDSGGEAYYILQKDGYAKLVVLMPGEAVASIKVDGDEILIKNQKGMVSTMEWLISNGQLLLTNKKGKSWHYNSINERIPIRSTVE